MSYVPGTKLSYKAGRAGREGDSSVIVMQNGGALEVRRGNNTFKGAAHRDRHQWASVADWCATLPAGATIQSKTRLAARQEINQHPDINQIVEKLRAAGLRINPIIFCSLIRPFTNAETIAWFQEEIDKELQKIAADPVRRRSLHAMFRINHLQKQIDKLNEDKTPNTIRYLLDTRANYNKIVLFGQAGDGSLQSVFINRQYGQFAVRVPDGLPRVANSLSELGFPRYFIRLEDRIVPF